LTSRSPDPPISACISQKTFAQFNGGESAASLSEHCLVLLAEQRESWQELKDAYDALKTVRTRNLFLNGFSVLLYYNPGRLRSATAAVGKNDVQERPCFLCLDNLPSEQKGIFYRNDYLILCNPRPVLPSHFTIAHVEHRPQAISESFDAFLNLTADLGHGWITLYNGPRCGASAPDHLHFQALPMGHMPIEHEIHGGTRLLLATRVEGVSIYAANDLGREILVLKGDNCESMTQTFLKVLAALKGAVHTDEEPMMNIAGFYDKGSWLVALFPRQKHRPDIFYKEGDERIVVSPGVVEMAGVLVTPMEEDFERLDAETVEAIYQEVSMDGDVFLKAIKNIV
jgi:hypothetical protein